MYISSPIVLNKIPCMVSAEVIADPSDLDVFNVSICERKTLGPASITEEQYAKVCMDLKDKCARLSNRRNKPRPINPNRLRFMMTPRMVANLRAFSITAALLITSGAGYTYYQNNLDTPLNRGSQLSDGRAGEHLDQYPMSAAAMSQLLMTREG